MPSGYWSKDPGKPVQACGMILTEKEDVNKRKKYNTPLN
jgi:hypothetical protein